MCKEAEHSELERSKQKSIMLLNSGSFIYLMQPLRCKDQ